MMETASSTMSMTKKKAKREVEKRKEEVGKVVVVEEERREGRDLSGFAVAEHEMGWEEFCPWLGGAVDEQMSWGSLWLPFWDVEFMCEANYSAFFGDVAWEDDIWNVRGIMEVPKP